MELRTRHISVVGLGKLGLPLATCLARKGFRVIGLDVDSRKIQAVNQGIASIYEPGLQEIMSSTNGRLSATDDYKNAILNSDITFILVPTPHAKNDILSLRYVLETIKHIGYCIAKKSDYHLVVLTSTVMPGSTEKEIRPLLEACSGKHCGRDFGLCYNPEFVALGSVIRDLLNPDFILIGESDPHSGSMLVNLYRQICENNPKVARMNFINAELTKLAVNTYITAKITFANTLARICEHLPGADVNIVTSALGLDSRIGSKYLQGAIGYGGPCFPRDNMALARLARSVGVSADIIEATENFNRQQVHWLTAVIKSHLPQKGKVGILGLAYKPNSDVVEQAQGLLLAQALTAEGIGVIAYDPAAMLSASLVLKDSVDFATCAEDCIQKADVVVLVTPWDEFKKLSCKDIARHKPPRIFVDCWRLLSKVAKSDGIIYLPLGVGGKCNV